MAAPGEPKSGGRQKGTPNRPKPDAPAPPAAPAARGAGAAVDDAKFTPRAGARARAEPGEAASPIKSKLVRIDSLTPHENNARTHSSAQITKLARSIQEFGWTNPILIDARGGIIAGHGRVMAARQLGMDTVPATVLDKLTAKQRRAYVIADNRLALDAGWDDELLALELGELREDGFDLSLTGFEQGELNKLFDEDPAGKGLTDADALPAPPAKPVSRIGDVWCLEAHRLVCGSSSDGKTAAHFQGVDLVLTDPPYCSGGFQENERHVGSVGTVAAHKQIANDRLSTRGFTALMREAVFAIPAPFFYVFTDWRQWGVLFDLAETSSCGVRSLIVWNKGTAGMGLGWRAQHELIQWSCRKTPPYPPKFPGLGNVLTLARQKNDLHTTQKPVELVQMLLQGAPFARTVADPFVGSGTTIIACEEEGRTCIACELDPLYVDVALLRWQAFTGKLATLEGTGETFEEVAAGRSIEQPAKPKKAATPAKPPSSRSSKAPKRESPARSSPIA